MIEILKLAIEKGGYELNWKAKLHLDLSGELELEKIILDPLFWRALEKAFCWYAGEHRQKAADYFDLVINGGDTEKFWKELK